MAATIIDQPQAETGKTINLTWKVTFELKFDLPHPMTSTEFVEATQSHLEWMHKDLNEKFPTEFLKTLAKYELIQRDTFKQKVEAA